LNGGDGHEDEFCGGINLWPYFSRSCFEGFGDNEGGFFRVYETVFRTLAEEEVRFGSGKSELPIFGNSVSDYSIVRQFYSFWGAFVTTKSFSWKDTYKASDLPNRQIRRLAEKENKKERDKAKRQFNEVVKRLVALVKRQDPRVALKNASLLREKEEKEKKEREEKERRATEREKERALARELEKVRLEALDFEEMGVEVSEEEEKETSNDFYCAACSKVFRSEKQLHNHEKSKKHKINIQQLRKQVSLSPEIESELQQQEELQEQQTSEKSDSDSPLQNGEDDDGLSAMLQTKSGFTGKKYSEEEDDPEVSEEKDDPEVSEEKDDPEVSEEKNSVDSKEEDEDSENNIPDEKKSILEEEDALSKMVQQQNQRKPKPKKKKHEEVYREHEEQVKKALENFQKISESHKANEPEQVNPENPKSPRKHRRRRAKISPTPASST